MNAYIWKRFWNVLIPPLIDRYEIGINDIVLMAIIFIEMFHYAVTGPSFRSLNSFVYYLSSSLSINLEPIIHMGPGLFWSVLIVV